MNLFLERANLQRALKQVRQNEGAPGIDGMTVDELPVYLRKHWLELRAKLLAGTYFPQPVRRVEIPKPDGRKRLLGIPTSLGNITACSEKSSPAVVECERRQQDRAC